MAVFKMKVYGGYVGNKSSISYHFDKNQIIEAPSGEFPEEIAEESKKISVDILGKDVETSAIEPKVEKRGRKKKK